MELMSTLARFELSIADLALKENPSNFWFLSNLQDWCRVHYAPLRQETKCDEKDDAFGSFLALTSAQILQLVLLNPRVSQSFAK